MDARDSAPRLGRIRAKSAPSSRSAASEQDTLLGHTAAVVRRLIELHERMPDLAERVGAPRLWHWAFWACVLHDLGKIAHGFQRQLDGARPPWGHRHEVLSLAFLEWALAGANGEDLPWTAAGIASHHRDLPELERLYPSGQPEDRDPVRLLVQDVDAETVEELARWLAMEPVRWAREARLPGLEAALQVPADPVRDFQLHAAERIRAALDAFRALARRLRRQPATSPENLAALAVRGLVVMSDHTASARVPFGPATVPELADMMQALSLTTPYPHQERAVRVAGHAILIAPTGSGKTEAALYWAAAQRSSGTVGRLYYVLPYQASLNAMRARIAPLFRGAVALQHSRALQALYRTLLEVEGYTPEEAAKRARHEAALARLHHHPVRLLTPYQLLRAAFRLKGYEATLTDAAGGIYVFDEIHAYEPRRLGMIIAMIEYLAHVLGGRFLIMSATLPGALAGLLRGALGVAADIVAPPELYRQFARHRLRMVRGGIGAPSTLEAIAQRATRGEAVLVVCNTIATANELYDALRERLRGAVDAVELLHGRFNARDRFGKERALLGRMGTGRRDRSGTPTVLVATQVVEVSLDVDFDTLFTEPAPLEALFQRFGRVNRRRRLPTADVHVLDEPRTGQGVYEDDYVAAALDVLAGRDGEPIDEERVAPWLDHIYAGPVGERWSRAVAEAAAEFRAACIADLRAFESNPELAAVFDRMFDGIEVVPAAVVSEYRAAREKDPLRAPELLVGISWRQFHRLRREGRIESPSGNLDVPIVHAPYDSERGLRLDAQALPDI